MKKTNLAFHSRRWFLRIPLFRIPAFLKNTIHSTYMDRNRSTPANSGQGLMEYLILVMVVGLFTLAVAKGFGGVLKRKFEVARDKVEREVVLGDR